MIFQASFQPGVLLVPKRSFFLIVFAFPSNVISDLFQRMFTFHLIRKGPHFREEEITEGAD